MAKFLFLVGKDSFNLKEQQKIDLKKLHVLLKPSEDFKVNGDPSTEIETFNTMTIGFLEDSYFSVSYKGLIHYKKITSLDFFLNIDKFKKNFFEEYIKQCLVVENRTKKNL